jgi:hypothetical protein
MQNKIRYVIAFVIIAMVIAFMVWKYTFRKTESSVSSQKADVELSAVELLKAFEQDENAANTLYLDKIIQVTGNVESVSEDSVGISVYLKEKDAVSGVICSFEKSAGEIDAVEKGMPVTIKGICAGYLMDVVMNKCYLESSGD